MLETSRLVLGERGQVASTDRPESRRPGAAQVAATIRESLTAAALRAVALRFVSAEETRDLLLARADQPAATTPAPAPARQRWEPDPLFVGREAELRQLTVLLEPGAERAVTPVVIHGLTGTTSKFLIDLFSTTSPSSRTDSRAARN